MRPVVSPALARIRRGPGTVQLGLHPSRAVVIGGLDERLEPVLLPPRGEPTLDLPSALAARGVEPGTGARLLRLLEEAGVLADAAEAEPPAGADPVDEARLAPERASAALVGPGSGRDVLARRAAACVEVRGGGRVGAQVTTLLAAAGVGHVVVDDHERVRPGDLAPGGLGPEHLGARRGAAAEQVCADSAPWVRTDLPSGRRPDVVVVAPTSGLGRAEAAELLAAAVPHLLALVIESAGVVGPLVLPGRSSCVRCADLHRTDRDRGWPFVVAQGAARVAEPACAVALAALVAAQAAQQVLALVDGWTPACLDATLETELPGGLTRRRSWAPHPACGCSWDEAG